MTPERGGRSDGQLSGSGLSVGLRPLLALLRVIVDVGVVAVEAGSGVAIELVPPNADQVLLTEDSSVGAQEVERAVHRANVEDLALCLHVRIVSGPLLVLAVERSLGDLRVNRVVDSSLSGNSRIISTFVLSIVPALTTSRSTTTSR